MNSPETFHPELDGQTAPAQGSSFGDILSEFEESQRQPTADGQKDGKKGTVVAVTAESVFVDIRYKTEGIIPVDEFRDASGTVDVKPGDQLIVTVKGRSPEGYYLLSKIKVERPKDWSSLEKAFADKATIGGVVTAVVKGGLSVDVGVRAFMPASRSGTRDVADLEALVGKDISVKIIKLDTTEEDVVVDRRVVVEEEELKRKQESFAALKEGEVVHGTVRSLTDFGAFVDIGGIDGLLHVADIAWTRINKPSDVLKVGDELDVKILKVNATTRRVSLGLKQLTPEPWTQAQDKYKVGDRVTGKVVRVVDFGAFVELEPGVEGLIHLSEMSWSKKMRKPQDVVKPGELVEVVVLGTNFADKRISLGLKQALGDPWAEVVGKYPVGSVAEGKITSLAKFGAFLELGEGIEGMIHVGDISAEKRINHPQDVLKMGETVKAQVLEIDSERRRIRLGMKQLIPTSVDEYISEHKAGDEVAGRVVDVRRSDAKVELGEGVLAMCRLKKEEAQQEAGKTESADISSLSAMLSAKWKQGKGGGAAAGSELRTGQVRNFRIISLDAATKRIDVELLG